MTILTSACKFTALSLLLIIGICVFRALVYFPAPKAAQQCEENVNHHPITLERGLVPRFQRALQFKTITRSKNNYDKEELLKYIAFIESSYPRLHSSDFVKRELIANYSLLYTVSGSDKSLKPYMLCAHLDVVPVEEDKWTVDPFQGVIRDGFIYGRGTIDVKDSLMGQLEALEYLLENGFRPRRTIYLAYGHDEEGSGFEGAQTIAETLSGRGVGDLLYLLDEGSLIGNHTFPGVSGLVAIVGVSEKGYVTFKMTTRGQAGHSSMSPKQTAIVDLAKIVTRFTSDAHPSRFGEGPERGLFESLAPHASFPLRLIYGNLWLFRHLLSLALSTDPMGNSLVRTTSAVTVISGGQKENVIPSEASAFVNHRLHPLDSIESVYAFDRRLINNELVELEVVGGNAFEPHPISPFDEKSFGYQTIKRTLREIFTDIVVVPGIMVASTDTKWYLGLTKNIYRFTPVVLNAGEEKLFHGHDERISIDNYVKIVNYYHHLISASDEAFLKPDSIVKDEL